MNLLSQTLSLTMATACSLASAQSVTLHVAQNGDDGNPGTRDKPLATLERARNAVRELKKQPGGTAAGGITVDVQAGLYAMDATLELGAEDSGTADAPVIYRAAPGAEVRLSGGRTISGFEPVSDAALLKRLDPSARSSVVVADLKAQGITEYGEPAGGFGYRGPPGKFAELFFNDRPMTIARWPNDGFIKVGDLRGGQPKDVRGTKGDKLGKFVCPYDRVERWLDEPDLWLHGWWFWDWADQRQKVASIDPETKVITLADPQHGYGYRKGMWYYAFNALSELDQPGEWCIDRENGLLYFWPPDSVESGRAVLCQVETLVRLKDVSHITLQGFIMENCRTTAVVASGGAGCRFVGCTFRNLSGWAVRISGSTGSGVAGCDIYETGEGGIALSGGDRKTLTPSGLYAENNHIHHFSRWNRILRPGIGMHGVGIRASHNLIHDAPHMAIQFSGNDNIIEHNEIHSVCYESNDAGAIYAGRNWTMRGTVIRYNYLHHISGFEGRGCVGVYLDDMFAGVHIYGNVFYDVTRAAFIGGGRDNIVENNLFVDCKPALHIDSRALGWASGSVQPNGTMHKGLQAVPYQGELWRQRYPKLVNVWEDEPAKPKGNIVARNICWGGHWDEVHSVARELTTFTDNVVETGRPFLDVTFQVRPDHPAWQAGFKRIPFEDIGLLRDEARASWPALHTVRPRGRRGEKTEVASTTAPAEPPRPVCHAVKAEAAPVVDGRIEPAEWAGADPSRALVIAEGLQNELIEPRSTAWIMTDGSALFVAVDNAVDPGAPLKRAAKWGTNDAVELAFRNTMADANAPILILRGYPCGQFESSTEAGATPAQVQKAAAGVVFAARIVDAGRWVTEWKIPLAALGIIPERHRRVEFNIAVKKTAQPMWLLWRGTRHATWQVGNAGWLELPR